MRALNILAVLALANMISAAAAFADDKGAKSSNGEFLWTAARSAMAEHRLIRLVGYRSSNEGVKVFANKMRRNEELALAKIKMLALRKGIKLPDDINYNQQAQINRLYQLSGNNFDRMFLKEMVKDNSALLAYMRSESQENKDSDIRDFATNSIPKINHYLRMANAINVHVASLPSPW